MKPTQSSDNSSASGRTQSARKPFRALAGFCDSRITMAIMSRAFTIRIVALKRPLAIDFAARIQCGKGLDVSKAKTIVLALFGLIVANCVLFAAFSFAPLEFALLLGVAWICVASNVIRTAKGN